MGPLTVGQRYLQLRIFEEGAVEGCSFTFLLTSIVQEDLRILIQILRSFYFYAFCQAPYFASLLLPASANVNDVVGGDAG